MLLSSEATRDFLFLSFSEVSEVISFFLWGQTKHNPIHTAAPENRLADRTVSSVRCVQSIIDQLMPYNVLPSVINSIHKHYCWNYATTLLMLNALQNTDHFPNIIMFMITILQKLLLKNYIYGFKYFRSTGRDRRIGILKCSIHL